MQLQKTRKTYDQIREGEGRYKRVREKEIVGEGGGEEAEYKLRPPGNWWSRGRVNFRRVPSGNASTFAATCYRPGIINFPLPALSPSLSLSLSPFSLFSFAFIIYDALTKFTSLPLYWILEFCDLVELGRILIQLSLTRSHIFVSLIFV